MSAPARESPGHARAEDPGEEDPDIPDSRSAIVKVLLVVLTAVVLPVLVVSLVAVRHPELSALDEAQHLDYLRRIESGEVPRIGDLLLPESVRDAMCRTARGSDAPECGLPLESYRADMLGADGYQYEAQQPPLYYAVTALVRRLIVLGPADGFVTTARLTGGFWLSAGLLVFWRAARRLGCRWWSTAAVTALLALGPGVIYQTATVNNDAAAVLSGSVALLLFVELRRAEHVRDVVPWLVVAVALVMVKPTGLISIAGAAFALLVDRALDQRLDWRRAALSLAPLLAAMTAYLLWGIVRDVRATIDYDVVLQALLSFKQVDELPWDDVVASVNRLPQSYIASSPVAPLTVVGPATLVLWALLAPAVSSLWARRWGTPAQRASLVAVLTLIVAGPAFTLLFYLDYSVADGPHGRYGLSLLPMLAVAAARLYSTRRGVLAMWSLAGLLLATTLAAVL